MALVEVSLGKEYSNMMIKAFNSNGNNNTTASDISTSITIPAGITEGIIITSNYYNGSDATVNISGNGIDKIVSTEKKISSNFASVINKYTCKFVPGQTVSATYWSSSYVKGISLMLLA